MIKGVRNHGMYSLVGKSAINCKGSTGNQVEVEFQRLEREKTSKEVA